MPRREHGRDAGLGVRECSDLRHDIQRQRPRGAGYGSCGPLAESRLEDYFAASCRARDSKFVD